MSPISIYEIGQKVRLGKWPAMAGFVPRLPELVVEQGAQVAPLNAAVCLAASTLDWTHRDPFDRIVAASALAAGAILVSSNGAFDGLPALRRVW